MRQKESIHMEVKILGTGCANCKRLEQVAREAIVEAGLAAQVIKVTEMKDIMAYPILSTPGLVINEKVVSSGRVPKKAEVVTWLMNAQLQ